MNHTSSESFHTPAPAGMSWLNRAARGIIQNRLSGLKRGRVLLCDGSHHERRAREIGQLKDDELQATMYVHSPRFYRDAVLGGNLSVAESYLQGDWECSDLTTFFRIFARNLETAVGMNRGLARVAGAGHRLFHWLHANTQRGSRRNIGAHYDLGNDFFRLWLDDSMAYSSAIFPTPDSTLLEGSQEKFDRVCRKLNLQPSDHLLEIGTGWGGLAVHAAKYYGCRVTTTTISRQQAEIAEERIAESGLGDRISLLRQDYRELSGQFDKLISIEMIEAVGHRFLDTYMQQCGRLLRPEGTMLLQAIVMPEQRFSQYLRSVDFIQRYIFPGGCLPSIASILNSAGRVSDLRLVHSEDFAPHYAETLRRWRNAFELQQANILQLGYSSQFIRLWRYYLCYCEAVFEERQVGVVQIQFDKPLCRRDPIRLSEWAARTANGGSGVSEASAETDPRCSEGQDSR